MASKDWFRRESWTETDAREFQARLKRSRGVATKSQYLRIQALHLYDTRDPALTVPALELLKQLFAEASTPHELASAHLQAARCYERLGAAEDALRHFRKAVDAQEAYPGVDAGTHLALAWFIATHALSAHYAEAEQLLKRARLVFPVQLFQARAIDAMLADAAGEPAASKRHAAAALDAAGAVKSPFERHPDNGLVGPEYRSMIDRLRLLATA